jgi:hypothetical protein
MVGGMRHSALPFSSPDSGVSACGGDGDDLRARRSGVLFERLPGLWGGLWGGIGER